ncbi:MAG: chorismate mutase, partial [Bacteroidota bacterium]
MNRIQEFLPINDWSISAERPFLIAGPCGVESEEQIYSVATDLAKFGVNVLRGGIWKPRTRPDSFQGIGSIGLSWLKKAGLENGMSVTTEVADPSHVEDALKAGVDMLWIGARTTVNPFLVQRLADSLHGVDVPVLIKNPVIPDLELWVGALERFQQAGISRIMAVHRGFSSSERSRFRNAPQWPIPIELRLRYPTLPIICDPSHIAGTNQLVGSVAQTAMDLDYDGLMVEVHPDPSVALSDKSQQLTPASFSRLLSSLVLRTNDFKNVISKSKVEELRSSIDEVDRQLVLHFAKRMELSKEIGAIKKENDVTIYQLKRWSDIVSSRPEWAVESGLNRDFIRKIFEIIHEESIHQQN